MPARSSRRDFLRIAALGGAAVGATSFGLTSCASSQSRPRHNEDSTMPKVGMNMLLWTDFVTAAHFPLFAELKAAGFDGVEVPLGRGDAAHYGEVRRALDGEGLACTAVTSLSPEANAISPDPAVRRAGLDHLEWAVDMCAVLGAETLCGPFHSAFKTFTGTGPTDAERRWCVEVMRPAADLAQQADLVLATEFLNRFECYLLNTGEQTSELVALVDHPAFGMTWDTHHAHIEVQDPAAAIRAAGPAIRHVHVSENDRGTPGRGQVRWRETFAALHAIDYRGWLTIEAFSRASPEFAAAIHIWRDFYPDKAQVFREGGPFIRRLWRETS